MPHFLRLKSIHPVHDTVLAVIEPIRRFSRGLRRHLEKNRKMSTIMMPKVVMVPTMLAIMICITSLMPTVLLVAAVPPSWSTACPRS